MKLSEIPTTNLRIVVSLALACIYVLTLLVLLACKVALPVEVAGGLGAFILAMLGVDVTQFWVKRSTYQAKEGGS